MHEEQSYRERKPVAAFVLSLLESLWMLASGVMGYSWRQYMQGERMWGEPMHSGWMWHHGMMCSVAPAFWWPWAGIIAGLVVLIGAVMLYRKPGQSQGWGMGILILSALNFFVGMGGFLASVLGIIGGALALAWRP